MDHLKRRYLHEGRRIGTNVRKMDTTYGIPHVERAAHIVFRNKPFLTFCKDSQVNLGLQLIGYD